MSRFKSIKEAVEQFRTSSEEYGVHWPDVADAAFIAGMGAAFNMAHNKTGDEIKQLMAEALAYAIERRMTADSGVMSA